jgi:hypothetical protein
MTLSLHLGSLVEKEREFSSRFPEFMHTRGLDSDMHRTRAQVYVCEKDPSIEP